MAQMALEWDFENEDKNIFNIGSKLTLLVF